MGSRTARVFACAGVLWAAAVQAQESGSSAATEEASLVAEEAVAGTEATPEIELIIVTGSRIRSSDVAGDAPVLSLGREELERSGLAPLGNVLQRLTAGGKAFNARFNNSGNAGYPADGGGIGAGSAQVDLRHLEAKRVLVLVDGQRWVNESSGSGIGGAVDLNTIPSAMIERVEVLQDGASAVYGSDAIAGVINIITRKSFDGVQLSSGLGAFDEGDGDTRRLELSAGRKVGAFDGVLTLSYDEQKRVSSGDRGVSSLPVPGTGLTRGSSRTPQGRFVFCDTVANPACAQDQDAFLDLALNDGVSTPDYPASYHPFSFADDPFNYAPFNLVVTPNRRAAVYASGRYRFADALSATFKLLHNDRRSQNQAAPEPIALGPRAGSGLIADNVFIPANQAFNPFGQDLDPASNFGLLGRRPLEAGPRVFTQDVRTTHLSASLEGPLEIGTRAFAWDVHATVSRSDARQVFRNGFNVRRIAQALGDPADCAAIPGCVPLDLFGGQGADGAGTITPAMLDWVRVTQRDRSSQELTALSANLTGDLFELPAGPLRMAAGAEFRSLFGEFKPDAARVSGESQDAPSLPAAGRYDVGEVYAEFEVPLLADRPLLRRLDLTTALRHSEYQRIGGETTAQLGLRWQPIKEVSVHGRYAQGFRAPFLGELFGQARSSPVLSDPCSNADGTALEANCRALGVPAGYVQADPQIHTRVGGSEALAPEKSDSVVLGMAYSPGWASRLELALDFYSHEVDDAIRAPDAQATLDACVSGGNPGAATCGGIGRAASGDINRFDNLLANIGRLETRGLDFSTRWSGEPAAWGQVSAAWRSTYVIRYRATDALGTQFPQRVGAEVSDSAIPRVASNLDLGWSFDRWSASWSARYLSAVTESCSDFLDGSSDSFTALGVCSDPDPADESRSRNELDAIVYHDVRVGWAQEPERGLRLHLGVDNLFEANPPDCLSCSLNGYDASTYEAPGRFGYLEAAYRF